MPLCPSIVDVVFSNRDIAITNLRLLSLPNEVITMICTDDEISAKDMCAIFLLDPFVMMTQASLQALVDICKHPLYGPHVRKVQLLNHRFSANRLSMLMDESVYAIDDRDTARMRPLMREIKWLMERIEQQIDFEESGEALELMTETFETFAETGESIAIASQPPNYSRPPIGWTKIFKGHVNQRDQPQVDNILGEPDMWSAFRLMLTAAQKAKCKVSKLEAGLNCFNPGYWRGVVMDDGFSDFQAFSRPLLDDVEELSFQFEWQTERARHNQPNIRAIEHLSRFARCMPKGFKTLSVRSDTDTVMMLSDLGASLETRKVPLKKLTFEKMFLVGDWNSIIAHIARAFELEEFTIDVAYRIFKRVRTATSPIVVGRIVEWYSTACRIKDKEQMRTCLEAFIESQDEEREDKRRQELAAKQEREAARRRELAAELRDREPRRSKRLAGKKVAADQADQAE
ncbi:hypothetical protein D6D13_08279 [Aureobasidium pullulans]|uniref:Uncharacterized protein n=1 Tax=Aureobasidium pullulans TaxID=5580 RepID=A0A4S9C774_AURPU|nr:hypothetical protein D6D13_08279 [Aureobasidium pullulans]